MRWPLVKYVVVAIGAAALFLQAGVAWAPWHALSDLTFGDEVICTNGLSFHLADDEPPPDSTSPTTWNMVSFATGPNTQFLAFSPTLPVKPISINFGSAVLERSKSRYFQAVPWDTSPTAGADVRFDFGFDGFADVQDLDGNPGADGIADVDLIDNQTDEVLYPVENCLVVPVDIRPFSSGNSFNPDGLLPVPVAILSNSRFDARQVRRSTVRFGATGTEASPLLSVALDIDFDRDTDLLFLFKPRDTGIECFATGGGPTGTDPGGGPTAGFLTGQTRAGRAIKGADAIVTPCPVTPP